VRNVDDIYNRSDAPAALDIQTGRQTDKHGKSRARSQHADARQKFNIRHTLLLMVGTLSRSC